MSAPVPVSRRALLAFIALADAPAPNAIRFHPTSGVVAIDVDGLAAMRTWATLFGLPTDQADSAHISEFTTDDGQSIRASALYPDWQGWHLMLHGTESADAHAAPLDPEVRDDLTALTQAA